MGKERYALIGMADRRRSTTRGFHSILCAVDFGPQSAAAVQAAAEIARRSDGHVTALCVEDPLLGQGAAAVGYDAALLRKSTVAQLEQLMRRVAVPAGLSSDAWSVETVFGRPAAGIVAFARKMKADLIVMGTHGRRGAAKLMFGSAAEGVLRRAPAPVLVVPGRRSRQDGRERFAGRVLGAIELGPTDRGDARGMAGVAAMFGAALTLLHVVPATPGPSWFAPRLAQHDRSRLLAAQARLDAIARSVGGQSRVVLGHPSEEIPAVALDTKAALIILALRRGRGLFGARQGTTTYRVLGGSPIPVLALPAGQAR